MMKFSFDLLVGYESQAGEQCVSNQPVLSKYSHDDIKKLVRSLKHEHESIHPNFVFDDSISVVDIHQRILASGYYEKNSFDLSYNPFGVALYTCYYINTLANQKIVKMKESGNLSYQYYKHLTLLFV